MKIEVESRDFSLEVENTDLGPKVNLNIPVCNITYPNGGVFTTLPNDAEEGRIGDIKLTITPRLNSYVLGGPDNLTISNALKLTEVETPDDDVDGGPGQFNFCVLDYNKDGVVTDEDIRTIFDQELIPLKYDINGDGVVDGSDRALAEEYIGSICPETDFPDVPGVYPGAFDGGDQMIWGHSLNRLLKTEHSNKPLFRVFMPVNYFSEDLDFSDPDLDFTFLSNIVPPSRLNLVFNNNRPGEYSTVLFAPEPQIRASYDKHLNDPNGPELAGWILVQDIYWRGSHDDIKDQLHTFYQEGKRIQQDYGIQPDEYFYNNPDVRFILNSVRVSIVYDQSGNGWNGYCAAKSILGAYSSEAGRSSLFTMAPIIMAMGRIIEDENGMISYSMAGWFDDDHNPFGYPDGDDRIDKIIWGGITINRTSFTNPTTTGFLESTPASEEGRSAYRYEIKDYNFVKRAVPHENHIDSDHHAVDVINYMLTLVAGVGLSGVLDGEGAVRPDILNYLNETYDAELYEYRDYELALSQIIKIATQSVSDAIEFRDFPAVLPSDSTIFGLPVKRLFHLSNFIHRTDEYGDANNPLDGWVGGVWEEEFTIGTVVNPATKKSLGSKDLFSRIEDYIVDDEGNIQNVYQPIFSNVYKNDQKIVFSQRIHNDNASYENPRHDLRINNKQGKYWGEFISSTDPISVDLMNVPTQLRQDGLGTMYKGTQTQNIYGRAFFETAGFYYSDYDSYQNALDDVNEFYSATPPPDAPHAPQE